MSENHHQESFVFVLNKLLSKFELGLEYSRVESVVVNDDKI
jgi:hypothetical protein